MIAILLVAVLASASAAPRHHSSLSPFDGSLARYLNQQMGQLDTQMSHIRRNYLNFTAEIHGNEYIITMTMPGFEEKDIVVSARKGFLMVQANNDQKRKSYSVSRPLPAFVGEEGSWSYENDILTIVLPVDKGDSGTKEVAPEPVSPAADRSPERPTSDNGQNANVDGSDSGNRAKDTTTNFEYRNLQ